MPRQRTVTAGTVLPDYLKRLGIEHPGAPSAAALVALHRAHVERVPYEVVDVALGRATTADPVDSVRRVFRGRGGYCVQINGAFSVLLRALGFDVRWHRAGVQASASRPPCSAREPAPHLALTVRVDGQSWLVDVGLGDGLYEPIPLRSGVYRQGPFEFRLRPSEVDEGGWRFDNDPGGSIAGFDFERIEAAPADFARWHDFLCTAPESRLVRAVTVMRRDGKGADRLTGCVLRRDDVHGRDTTYLESADEWFAALREVFGLALDDVGTGERTALWTKVRAAHERWLAAKAAAR